MSYLQIFRARSLTAVFGTLLVAFVLLMSSCGGSSSSGNPPVVTPATSQVQVNIGDSPADWVVSFSMAINSMSLIDSSGKTVSVITSPTSLEVTHLMGTMQPLCMISIAQGTYNSAKMTIGSATVSYMDPVTHNLMQKTVSGPVTVTINFSPNMVLGTSPMALNFDMKMATSVSIDNSGNVTFTPNFSSATGMMGTGNSFEPEHGGMQHVIGSISSVTGNSFSISTLMGAQSVKFNTDNSTVFEGGLSGMGMMGTGMLVMVDAVMQSDGSMLAKTVERTMDSGGMMAEGLVNGVTGNPATQLTLIAHNGMGAGMMSSVLGNVITANVDSGTAYKVDNDLMDISGLPFTPVFDASHIYAGQRIAVESTGGMMSGGMGMGGGMMAGTVNASAASLEQQGFSGMVSNYTPNGSTATFTLTLPPDCGFATITGTSTVTVYQLSSTGMFGMNVVTNGSTVHVRGLLFQDAGSWKLAASRIMTP